MTNTPVPADREALITGIGLITGLGEGASQTHALLAGPKPARPAVETDKFAPYPVVAMAELDLSSQIARRGDRRQMGPWQRFGVYSAGLALDDAGIKDDAELLGRTNLIVAAGGGERDPEADTLVLEAARQSKNPAAALAQSLLVNLRPTLFLSQLSNLLAGNISIVHHVTGSSRTFMGEELAGAMALQVALRRIQSGQGELFLVGGAYNAEREDMLLLLQIGQYLWQGDPAAGVWQRAQKGGGILCGSMGAFLVIESRAHAVARGAKVYGRLDTVATDTGPRQDEAVIGARLAQLAAALEGENGEGPLGYLCGASGAKQATEMERAFIDLLSNDHEVAVRSFGSVLGHGLEAQMPVGVALAAAALDQKRYYPPFDPCDPAMASDTMPGRIAVTSFGHWRGEAVALVARAD
ncbi:MAG: beta-ketoacyl-ACP synthase [Alphaproteobacteria bacterium]|nr:MAG: beta-ketoacyl-ACP synthase [Alphaproteobacteria bacterium]